MLAHRRASISLLIAAAALATSPLRAQTKEPPLHKVVLQVSDADPQKWNLALNNARNLQDDLGAERRPISRSSSTGPASAC